MSYVAPALGEIALEVSVPVKVHPVNNKIKLAEPVTVPDTSPVTSTVTSPVTFPVTAPVIGHVKALAFTVPDTSNFVLGVVVPIPILDSAPSMVITVDVTPPSLTLKVISVF